MKTAIFHNFMDNIGGAEMVCLTLAREFGADLYSTNVDNEKIAKMGFGGIPVQSIGRVPLDAPFRQQIALARFRALNLRGHYDFYIIGGDWAVSAAVNHKPNIWYVHSPIREIWDLCGHIRKNYVPFIKKPLYDLWVAYNRYLNRRYVAHIQKIACNSATTRQRVTTYLHRNARIIHPPIDTSHLTYKQNNGFWLSVNRLFTHKRVDMQLKAFETMPDKKLVIVGSYERSSHFQRYAKHIQNTTPPNVAIKSWVDSKELADLYARCRGFITTSLDEDFGMSAVEAMAAGKPVIAPNEGGYRETVIDGITGRLIDNIDAGKLAAAVCELDTTCPEYKNACIQRARAYDTSYFIKSIYSLMNGSGHRENQ
ncbi:MAG: glycosyltransferase [Chitinivibrionales bacterium]|nr:glycosyltransferase [Chitinivibrionales bacterium]